jgi:hypothetical protein
VLKVLDEEFPTWAQGPLTTLYVFAPVELLVTETVKLLPEFGVGAAPKVIVGAGSETTNAAALL